ncbi:soluble lytic murein transglycosylase-like protein [Bradyrhizobium sp. USDA 377]
MSVSPNPSGHARSVARQLAFSAALCLLILPGSGVAAQSDDEVGKVEASAVPSPDEADPDGPQPLQLEPFAPRPLTAADLPPANFLSGSYAPHTSATFGRDWRAGRAEYRGLVEREALAVGLPPALLDAVMAVESRYNSAAVGLDGEVGLMQVMLPTARMLGFTGTPAELAAPAVNVHYGAQYLAGAWRRAGGDLCTATMKYRAGHGETRFSFLSVDYCMRVRAHLSANGVPVTGSVPQPVFGRPAGGPRGQNRGLSVGNAINFAALNTRLRTLSERKVLPDSR